MTKSKKSYSPEQKVAILKKHLVDGKQVSEICDEQDLHPTMFYRWQKKFFENGTRAFENGKDTKSKILENKVAKLENKLAQKDKVLSEVMEEHVALKKKLGEN